MTLLTSGVGSFWPLDKERLSNKLLKEWVVLWGVKSPSWKFREILNDRGLGGSWEEFLLSLESGTRKPLLGLRCSGVHGTTQVSVVEAGPEPSSEQDSDKLLS